MPENSLVTVDGLNAPLRSCLQAAWGVPGGALAGTIHHYRNFADCTLTLRPSAGQAHLRRPTLSPMPSRRICLDYGRSQICVDSAGRAMLALQVIEAFVAKLNAPALQHRQSDNGGAFGRRA